MKLSWNDYCYVFWSLETKVPLSQRKQSSSLYQWILEIRISSARVQMGVLLHACWFVVRFTVGSQWWNHFTSATTIQHITLSMVAHVPAILTWYAPFVCVCVKKWEPLETHSVISMNSYNCMKSVNSCIQLQWHGKKIQHLSSKLSLSLSWYVLSPAAYLFNAPETIQHHCLSAPQMVHIFL
jgi:hypothetical protein